MKAQLVRAVVCLTFFAALAGCVGGQSARDRAIAVQTRELSTIYERLTNFADDYVTHISSLYTEVLQDNHTPIELRRDALRTWLAAVRAAYINATDDNPLDGLINMVILIRVQRYIYSQPEFERSFGGPHARLAHAMMADEERRVWAFAGEHLTADQTDELRNGIDHWLKKHPSPNVVGLVRLSDIREARETAGKESPGSIFNLAFFDPMAPTVRELQRTRLAASRMFYYLQRWPIVLRLETELMWADLLAEPQVTGTIEQFLKLPTHVAAERSAAIEQLAASIDHVGQNLVDRIAEATARERAAALRDAGTTINHSQHLVWEDFDAVNKTFMTRLVISLCLAALIIAVTIAMVMLGYRWAIHRMLAK